MEQIQLPGALLWDLDGTVVNSEPLWHRATTEILDRFGARLSDAQQLALVGVSLWESARVLQENGVTLPAAGIVQMKANRVAELYSEQGVDWRPGARELILEAAAAGIPNVMVTMCLKNVAQAVIDQFPAGTFTALFGGDDFAPGEGKPTAAPYLAGAAAVGMDPQSCIAFEDSYTGLASATAAGTFAIGVRHLIDLSETPASIVLDSLADIKLQQVSEFYSAFKGQPYVAGGHRKGK